MPYDPNWPQNGQLIDADRFRGQFSSLVDLINGMVSGGVTAAVVDAVNTLPPGSAAQVSLALVGTELHFSFGIPQGQEGPVGSAGPPFAQAVVDSVTTLNPGDPATVGVSFDGSNVRFSFGLPRGADGPPGTNGSDGAQGQAGPAFAEAVVDSVTTVNPGDPAWVNVNFDGSNVRFHFGVPRGADGATGMTGNDGAPGAQGAPGEVSTADLNNAIASAVNGTSNNTNNISTLDNGFGDPDMEALRQKINEVILNGRR